MSDWSVPFAGSLELSGEFYRGRGIGGLGAGFGRSAVWSGSLFDPSTIVRGLDATGGWAQLKFKPAKKYEFNGAFGQDSSGASTEFVADAGLPFVSPRMGLKKNADG